MHLPVLKYKVGDKVRISNKSKRRTLVGHVREIEAVFPLAVHGWPYRLQFCSDLFRENELELYVSPARLDAPDVTQKAVAEATEAVAEATGTLLKSTFETDSARDLPLGPVIVDVTQEAVAEATETVAEATETSLRQSFMDAIAE